MTGEAHIVLVWANAAEYRVKIHQDIAQRFKRLGLFQVTWSAANFSRNISRFYGKSLPLDSDKIQHCGTGAFSVAVILDESPAYGFRWTSKGGRWVNTNVFDAKELYREWTGGGHRIHATDNVIETDHDLALLFGRSAGSFLDRPTESWEEPPEILARDLSGAAGWRDLTELFEVLNLTQRYVVLRNFDTLPNLPDIDAHGDIDLLVEDFANAAFICNAEPVFDTCHRVFMHVPVDGHDMPFDLRYQGDQYYDTVWERDILDRRLLDEGGFYIPAPDDHFYSLLYHAIIHKPQIAPDYIVKLNELALQLGHNKVSPAYFTEYRWMKGTLNQFFKGRGYNYTKPLDPSVYINHSVIGETAEVIKNRFQVLLEAVMLTPPYHAKRNDIFFTRVWQMSMPDGSMAALKLVDPISEEARPQLFREHKFLSRLKDGPFVQHLAHGNLNDSYFLLTRWIDGFELTDESAMAIYLTDDTLRTVFREACQNIVDRLAIAGIKHRDIREKNILVENGQPVLIDFGWSIFQSEENVFTPKNLEEPDDQTALNKMLYRLLGTEVAS